MKVRKINKVDKRIIEDLNILLAQFPRDYRINPGYFKKLIKKSHVFGLFDKNRVVGTATLIELYKLSGHKASIEHLIIHKDYRGKGLGTKMINYVISFAKKMKIGVIFLTTDKDNIAANSLYKKLGFKLNNSNFYQLKLNKK